MFFKQTIHRAQPWSSYTILRDILIWEAKLASPLSRAPQDWSLLLTWFKLLEFWVFTHFAPVLLILLNGVQRSFKIFIYCLVFLYWNKFFIRSFVKSNFTFNVLNHFLKNGWSKTNECKVKRTIPKRYVNNKVTKGIKVLVKKSTLVPFGLGEAFLYKGHWFSFPNQTKTKETNTTH